MNEVNAIARQSTDDLMARIEEAQAAFDSVLDHPMMGPGMAARIEAGEMVSISEKLATALMEWSEQMSWKYGVPEPVSAATVMLLAAHGSMSALATMMKMARREMVDEGTEEGAN